MQAGARVDDAQTAIQMLMNLDAGLRVALAVLGAVGLNLQALAAEGDRVVGGDGAQILEAADVV